MREREKENDENEYSRYQLAKRRILFRHKQLGERAIDTRSHAGFLLYPVTKSGDTRVHPGIGGIRAAESPGHYSYQTTVLHQWTAAITLKTNAAIRAARTDEIQSGPRCACTYNNFNRFLDGGIAAIKDIPRGHSATAESFTTLSLPLPLRKNR